MDPDGREDENTSEYSFHAKYRIFEYIEKVTAQKPDDIINKFNETHQNTPIDDDTLCDLFTDADKAKSLLMNREELHKDLRYMLNKNAPATEAEAKASGKMQKLPWYKSIFHNPFKNNKYVSKDGHLEGVYDRKSGKSDRNPNVMATFNFFDPNSKPIEHKKADVDTYGKWGN